MTFEQLKALDAVVKFGSVRAAAEHLFKTPPSVSSLIKNLESDVGIKLLSRDAYRPTLTQEGELFYRKATQVLSQMHELKSLSQRMSGSKELVVNIAINAVCPLDRLLTTLMSIEKKHPETQINVSTEHLGGAMERLKLNEVDIAVTTSLGMVTEYMEASPAFTIPIVPLAQKGHPLTRIKGTISKSQASEYPQVIVRDSSRTSEKQTLDVIEGGRHCHVTDFISKKKLLDSGLGWGGLPLYLVEEELKNGSLVALQIDGYSGRRSEQFLIRRSDKAHGLVSQEVWDSLHQSFSSSSND